MVAAGRECLSDRRRTRALCSGMESQVHEHGARWQLHNGAGGRIQRQIESQRRTSVWRWRRCTQIVFVLGSIGYVHSTQQSRHFRLQAQTHITSVPLMHKKLRSWPFSAVKSAHTNETRRVKVAPCLRALSQSPQLALMFEPFANVFCRYLPIARCGWETGSSSSLTGLCIRLCLHLGLETSSCGR